VTAVDWVRLGGGEFTMGSDRFYPEEQPVHRAAVEPFELARYAVTNAQFAEFVDDTGYVTMAERPLDPEVFRDAESTEPGSLVFEPTAGPVDLRDWRSWWRWVHGASWRHPRGPASDLEGMERHPVVQVAYEDATAYTAWVGARLPTEAEWEYAARGGLEGATFAWGEEPNDGTRANSWQGRFPYDNTGASGWVYTAPVGSFPPNGYGLHEMTGNTWEWTATMWSSRHQPDDHCAPSAHGHHHNQPSGSLVTKGGSHLCAPEYCLRYRPAARTPQTPDSSTTHLGFRVAR
jgi:formylglycine-generating enzyme required for sulfatase activity